MKNLFQVLLLKSFLALLLAGNVFAQKPPVKYLTNQTVTYSECISFYKELDETFSNAKLITCGMTDIGKPLHLFVISSDGDFDPASLHAKNKRIILVNNGIHPGEPDGIDASMKLAYELLSDKSKTALLDHVVVCIIPVYNIDGALNRSCCSRANQNGPGEYGFRGNGRNLDLNRDFIKCDSENAKSFTKIFRQWDFDVMADTHVSNGADYPYTMTLISTQHNKLNPVLGTYLKKEMTPALFEKMKEKKDEMITYVNSFDYDDSPDKGIVGFLEIPRFSTGYAALFNTLGFVAETHMFKPFAQRVESTYNLLLSLLEFTSENYLKIGELRTQAKADCKLKTRFDLQWKADTTKYEMINYKGYEAKYKTSDITGLQRMYYDRNAPYEKQIKFYDEYTATVSVEKPYAYIIPQAWKEVIDRLKINRIEMKQLKRDTVLEADVYYIENFSTSREPYEGHYLHSKVELKKENKELNFYEGDYIVYANQESNRYIVETLEPQGVDSWFAWGFFDATLQQKEWFSSYVFEEKAEEILIKNSSLRKEFEQKQKTDSAFAKNSFEQLAFIYRHSPYFEKSYKRYPVARINNTIILPEK